MATKIVTKNSSTASAVPTASDLVQGELAVNVADKRLFTEDNAGAIVELGTNPSALTVTGEITANGGIALGDNDKATFGASDDLQIYHDGSNSKIENSTGYTKVSSLNGVLYLDGNDVRIRSGDGGETGAKFIDNGASELYYDNSKKLATTSTGIDVTGTATMDGLTVDGRTDLRGGATPLGVYRTLALGVDTQSEIVLGSQDLSNNYVDAAKIRGLLKANKTDGELSLYTLSSSTLTPRLNIASNGDISFYEDTGTTPKFFWDASAESLGIGTSSPSYPFHLSSSGDTVAAVTAGAASVAALNLGNSTNLADGGIRYDNSANALILRASNTERMRIDASGNVGIGKTPNTNFSGYVLQLNGGSQTFMSFGNSTTGTTLSDGLVIGNDNSGADIYQREAQPLRFHTSNTERMRIDSSGNLLVGKTTTGVSGAGTVIRAGGELFVTRAGDVMNLNRLTSDGEIAYFRKDGAVVGSIGSNSGYMVIGSPVGTDAHLLIGNGLIHPATSTGGSKDNAIDIGGSSNRFKDIYATNGTIQTSDRNEKQDIAELSDAEQRVAVAAKGLLRKFRWKDSVAEKGDEARTHFGIIAQDLQAAFAAEGLDAGDYAMFISSTWTDEETNEEKTRMGVRYSELLAFIIAAI